jgi:hypothetical protein
MENSMGGFEDFSSRTPLVAVDTEAMIRMWRFLESQLQTGAPSGPVGYDIRLIQDQVGPGSDAISVFFRTALLKSLFQQGLLDEWREGPELRQVVFDVAACYPMENGVGGFDADAFLNEIRARATDLST